MKEPKVLAKNIYLKLKELKKNNSDTGTLLFSIVKEMMSSDIDKVFENYQSILEGNIIVIEVLSATELTDKQVKELEKNIKLKFPNNELVFDYRIDLKVKGGVVIRHNDNVIDKSLEKSIQELQV